MILEAMATLVAGIFGGAALYINLAEHPARMERGTRLAVTVFGPSYRRAAVMQASLAAVDLLAGVEVGRAGTRRHVMQLKVTK